MANWVAANAFTKAELQAKHGTRVAQGNGYSETSPYANSFVIDHSQTDVRVHYNPANFQVNVEILAPDRTTGIPTWTLVQTYTAA